MEVLWGQRFLFCSLLYVQRLKNYSVHSRYSINTCWTNEWSRQRRGRVLVRAVETGGSLAPLGSYIPCFLSRDIITPSRAWPLMTTFMSPWPAHFTIAQWDERDRYNSPCSPMAKLTFIEGKWFAHGPPANGRPCWENSGVRLWGSTLTCLPAAGPEGISAR